MKLWSYATKIEKMGGAGRNTRFRCNYCQVEYKGGSYFRLKSHLHKFSGKGIKVCPKVTPQHVAEMQKKVEAAEKRLKMSTPKKGPLPPSSCQSSTMGGGTSATGGTGGFRLEGFETTQTRKRRATGTTEIEKVFNQGAREHLHCEIARMFYSGG
ncbi:hypothetical protein Acr_15g0009000 [Actinidia rufa]|uniref:BED-type domain-containing protein n=1 Tax=Actinidia rufa TaxID=165716 RepID=A0A7J0FUB5_9ERIC|nr:hypothetical protein Acr_15g0009000 [Actinidia rufa]